MRRPGFRPYFTGRRFGSILVMPVPLFTSMIWSRNSAARSNSRFAEAISISSSSSRNNSREIEIAAAFPHDGRLDLPPAQNGVQAFLHRPPHLCGVIPCFSLYSICLRAPIIGNRNQRLHALRDGVREEDDFAIHVPRRAAGGLDERSLAAQISFLVRIENADERDFRQIESFPQED